MKYFAACLAFLIATAVPAQKYNGFTDVPTNFNARDYSGPYTGVAAKYGTNRYATIFAGCAAYTQVSAEYNAGVNQRMLRSQTTDEGKAYKDMTDSFGTLSQNAHNAHDIFASMATIMDTEEHTSPVFGWRKEYDSKLDEYQKLYKRMTGPLETELEQNVMVCLNIGKTWAVAYDATKKKQ